MASLIENLLEPQRLEVPADARLWLLLVALAGAAAGSYIVWLLIRRQGEFGDGLSRSESILGFPVAIAAFVMPWVFLSAIGRAEDGGNPLIGAVVQAVIALACIGVLAHHPWRSPDEQRGSWFRLVPRRLIWVPLVWLAAVPVLQLAMFASVLLHDLLGAPTGSQGVVDNLRSGDSAAWIVAWYVMAVVAAPLMEEFVFRVVLFGGSRQLLGVLSNAQGWRHPGTWIALAFSIGTFVAAHGVWDWTVGILPLTLLSVFLTALYAHTRSFWPGVLMHALHNAFVVTMQFFVID